MKKLSTLLVFTVLCIAALDQPKTEAADAEPSKQASTIFGKSLAIMIHGSEVPLYIEDASIQRLGEIDFICGPVADFGDDGNWTTGSTAYVALNRIESFFSYDPQMFKKKVRDAVAQPKNEL